MLAPQTKRESSLMGDALQPAGGSDLIAFRSLMSLSCAADEPDIFRKPKSKRCSAAHSATCSFKGNDARKGVRNGMT